MTVSGSRLAVFHCPYYSAFMSVGTGYLCPHLVGGQVRYLNGVNSVRLRLTDQLLLLLNLLLLDLFHQAQHVAAENLINGLLRVPTPQQLAS